MFRLQHVLISGCVLIAGATVAVAQWPLNIMDDCALGGDPPAETCATATPITVAADGTQTCLGPINVAAHSLTEPPVEPPPPNCAGPGYGYGWDDGVTEAALPVPVWFQITPPVSGTLTFTTCHPLIGGEPVTRYQGWIDVFEGDCAGGLSYLGCSDQAPECSVATPCSLYENWYYLSGDYHHSTVNVTVNAGTTYYFQVMQAQGDIHNFDLFFGGLWECTACLGVCASLEAEGCGPDPDADVCSDALLLQGASDAMVLDLNNISHAGETYTSDPGCGLPSDNHDRPVWFQYTTPYEGDVVFSTCTPSTGYAPVVEAFTGPDCSNLTLLACASNGPAPDCTLSDCSGNCCVDVLIPGMPLGQTLWFRVGNYAAGDGCDYCLGVEVQTQYDGDPCDLDEHDPFVELTGISDLQYLCGAVDLHATMNDPDNPVDGPLWWTLDYRPLGDDVEDPSWTVLAEGFGEMPKDDEYLATFDTTTLTEDGYYLLRLAVSDACRKFTQVDSLITVLPLVGDQPDVCEITRPWPNQPPNERMVVRGDAVCIKGSVYGGLVIDDQYPLEYIVEYQPWDGATLYEDLLEDDWMPIRATGPNEDRDGDGTPEIGISYRIHESLASWNTTVLPDGLYAIRLTGYVDCGNVLSTVYYTDVIVDNDPPEVGLTSPEKCGLLMGDIVDGILPIYGWVNEDNLYQWRLYYTGNNRNYFRLLKRSTTDVSGDDGSPNLLMEWDVTGLPPCSYTIYLIAYERAYHNCSNSSSWRRDYEVVSFTTDYDGNNVPDVCNPVGSIVKLEPQGNCAGAKLYVDINSYAIGAYNPDGIVGGQFNLAYDTSKLSFVTFHPGSDFYPDSIFDTLFLNQDYGDGDISGSVFNATYQSTTENSTIGVIEFDVVAGLTDCEYDDLLSFRPPRDQFEPPTRLSTPVGEEAVVMWWMDLPRIGVDSVGPTFGEAPGALDWTVATGSPVECDMPSDPLDPDDPEEITDPNDPDYLPHPPSPDETLLSDNCSTAGAISLSYSDTIIDPATPPCDAYQYTIERTWTATDACGNTTDYIQLVDVIDTTAPTFTVPVDIVMNADAGGCDLTLTVDEIGIPTDMHDNCTPVADLVVTPTRDDGLPLTDPFPTGDTTITWEVADACGNASTQEQVITVNSSNYLYVDVELQGISESYLSRCITFELWNCDTTSSVEYTTEVVFTYGMAENVPLEVPCGDYGCITARDTLHTLRRTSMATLVDNSAIPLVPDHYEVAFVDDVAGGWLIGGNLNDDEYIDILDYGVFTWQWSEIYYDPISTLPTGDTTCTTAYPHADINGNAIVKLGDFSYIYVNFWQEAEANCCGVMGLGRPAGLPEGPIDRIALKQLRAAGLEHLAVGDLNADGWLDAHDMAAFIRGARPKPIVPDELSNERPDADATSSKTTKSLGATR